MQQKEDVSPSAVSIVAFWLLVKATAKPKPDADFADVTRINHREEWKDRVIGTTCGSGWCFGFCFGGGRPAKATATANTRSFDSGFCTPRTKPSSWGPRISNAGENALDLPPLRMTEAHGWTILRSGSGWQRFDYVEATGGGYCLRKPESGGGQKSSVLSKRAFPASG